MSGARLEQLLFPFMRDYVTLSDYVHNEIPFMKEQHDKYVAITQDPISFNDFTVEHYCNPHSLWYMAEEFHDKYTPLRIREGVIVPKKDYPTYDNYQRSN